MNAALVERPLAGERLPWEQICRLYPDAWVMLSAIDKAAQDDLAIRSAVVVGHGRSRKEAFESTREQRAMYPSCACRFTGTPKLPEGPIALFLDLRR